MIVAKNRLRHETSENLAINFTMFTVSIVSLAAIFSLVTQRSSPQTAVCGEDRCVTRLKTAARETTVNMKIRNIIYGLYKLSLPPANDREATESKGTRLASSYVLHQSFQNLHLLFSLKPGSH